MLTKNELHNVTIEDINNLGYGICRIDSMVVFVADAVPRDVALIRIIKVAKHYAVARVEELIKPSCHRVGVPCPSFTRCGGCAYLHLDDEYEASIKENLVTSEVKKAGLDIPVRSLIRSKEFLQYRNKAQYPIYRDREGHVRLGFYARHTHAPVAAEDCLLQPEIFSKLAHAFCREFEEAGLSCYDEESGRGFLRHLNLRSDTAGHVLAEIVVNSDGSSKLLAPAERVFNRFSPALIGICVNHNTRSTNVIRGAKSEVLFGTDTLTQTLGDKVFCHGPASFFQVNTHAATLLFEEAARLLDAKPEDTVCDLYCGVGAVGQCVAPKSRLHGADVVKEAISYAEKNAKKNGCDAAYVAMDAADYFEAAGKFDIVLLDPPRGGISPEMTELLRTKLPKKILYISCNPATLCRDLAHLGDLYETDGITPVDLFPQTGHVESVCLLKRRV